MTRTCYTPDEFATARRISVRTVYRLIARREIPAERVGRQWRIWMTRQQATDPPEVTAPVTSRAHSY